MDTSKSCINSRWVKGMRGFGVFPVFSSYSEQVLISRKKRFCFSVMEAGS